MIELLDKQTRLTGNQYRIIAAAILGDMLEFFDYFLIGFVLAFIVKPWQLTFGQSAVILLSSGIGAMAGAFFWGSLADRIGRKKVFIATVLNFPIAPGDGEVEHGGDEDLLAADPVGERAPEECTRHRADARRQQDHRRLAEGQLPRLDDEGQHEADEEIVEELQHVAEDRRGDDAILVAGEPRLLVEKLDHVSLPFGPGLLLRAECSVACRSAPLRQAPPYLIASGLAGEPTAPVIGSAGATNMNS